MDLTNIINYLQKNHLTIATMESCTGGLLASLLTDVIHASEVLKFSAITYCNEYKIKMGVDANIIKEYSVYSSQTARDMAKKISQFANADIGVGITGQLSIDEGSVDLAIYDKKIDKYYEKHINIQKDTRQNEKLQVIKSFIQVFTSTYNC